MMMAGLRERPWPLLIATVAFIAEIQGQQFGTSRVVTNEFCNMETFNATCPRGQVVVMTNARYGRMRKGRCVKRNLGYIGCAVDVMTFMDTRCSGRRQCTMPIPDPALYETQPCPEDTTPYLEAAYQCIKVADGGGQLCAGGRHIALSEPAGFLSSSVSEGTGYGTGSCPWKIHVQSGQAINLTIFNFNRGGGGGAAEREGDEEHAPWRPDVCYEYAILKERGHMKRITPCGGEKRQTHLYLSKSNELEIQVVNEVSLKNLGAFLIKYEAVGCADLKPPVGGWVKREGANAEVRCNHSNEVWYVTCKDNSWRGIIGNCSHGSPNPLSILSDPNGFPYGILIVVAIGVALGIFLGGLLLVLAIVYMKRRQRSREARMEALQYRDPVQERKVFAGMHTDSPRDWQHHRSSSKFTDSEDALIRDNLRINTLPYHDRDRGALPNTPGGGCSPDRTCPADPYGGQLVSFRADPSRNHIYECPKFT